MIGEKLFLRREPIQLPAASLLAPRARKALLLRPWPGNLVELRNELRRLATLGERRVDVEDLGPVDPGETATMREAVSELEQRMIVRALRLNEGNLTRTAESLGLSQYRREFH